MFFTSTLRTRPGATREAAAARPTTTLIEFWAPWAAPAVAMAGDLADVLADADLALSHVRFDIEEDPEAAARHQVRAVPTLIVLRDGEEVCRHTGQLGTAAIQAFLHRAGVAC
ncbi:thioredoxin 2 [Natronocella acetinitrilica]|uniref:Thioredoxin 2 n=1 Tax=Natronocella acetinitrilica TaxID=414046 RepID=A0AAE3G1Z7_9GAMM|nr:thioredoxin family protein [Natronocella acetinitrilica]MCP1674109.1 thioredoxin 2 [Natronocella acetinitrilica]